MKSAEVSLFDKYEALIIKRDELKKQAEIYSLWYSRTFGDLMDAGKSLMAKVTNIKHQEGFTQISIGIYLQDF